MRTIISIAIAMLFTAELSAAENLRFEVLVGEEQICKDVAEELQRTVKLVAFGAPATHQAGTPLSFEMTFAKSKKLDDKMWTRDYSSVNLNSIIEKPYTKFIHHTPTHDITDFFFEDGESKTFKVSTNIAPNIGGEAKHRLSFTLATQNFSYCMVGALVGSTLDVMSSSIDITPPLIRSVQYDKLSYRPGEEITAIFEFSESLRSPESDHIDFRNRAVSNEEPSSSFPPFDSDVIHRLTQVSERSYSFTFRVPEKATPGSYHLSYFNRFDGFGNFEDEVGGEDRYEKQVVETTPLVVSTDFFQRVDNDIRSYQSTIKAKQDEFGRITQDPHNKHWVKAKLAYMYDIDQFTREYLDTPRELNYSEGETNYFWSVFVPKWLNLDFRNTEDLKDLVAIWDWFTVSTFGAPTDNQAWLIVQHADHDTEFQNAILSKLEKLYPVKETSPKNYAYLYDRVAASWQKPDLRKSQLYGTQGQCVEPKRWEPLPIEDEVNVDKRRQEVGLPPLKDYIDEISKRCT